MHPYMASLLGTMRVNDMLKDAESHRLASEARQRRPAREKREKRENRAERPAPACPVPPGTASGARRSRQPVKAG